MHAQSEEERLEQQRARDTDVTGTGELPGERGERETQEGAPASGAGASASHGNFRRRRIFQRKEDQESGLTEA